MKQKRLPVRTQLYADSPHSLTKHGLGDSVADLWALLEEEVILPLIAHMGARTYGFLHPSILAGTDTIESLIDELVERHGDDVRVLFGKFLEPTDDNVRGLCLTPPKCAVCPNRRCSTT